MQCEHLLCWGCCSASGGGRADSAVLDSCMLTDLESGHLKISLRPAAQWPLTPHWDIGSALTQREECHLLNHKHHFLLAPASLEVSVMVTGLATHLSPFWSLREHPHSFHASCLYLSWGGILQFSCSLTGFWATTLWINYAYPAGLSISKLLWSFWSLVWAHLFL